MPVTPLRVALADDALLFREGLVRILSESGFEVVGHHPDAAGLLAQVRADPPDVVVLDPVSYTHLTLPTILRV